MPKVLMQRTGGARTVRAARSPAQAGIASALQRLADTSPVVARLRGLGGPVQRAALGPETDPEARVVAARDRSVQAVGSAGADVLAREVAGQAAHVPVQRQAGGVFQLAGMILQLMPKPAAENQKLKNIVNALFKGAPAGGEKIGDGSAMAAANQEVNGGDKVGGRDHVKKLESILNGLYNLYERDQNPRSPFTLSDADYDVVIDLIDACNDALDGIYAG